MRLTAAGLHGGHRRLGGQVEAGAGVVGRIAVGVRCGAAGGGWAAGSARRPGFVAEEWEQLGAEAEDVEGLVEGDFLGIFGGRWV